MQVHICTITHLLNFLITVKDLHRSESVWRRVETHNCTINSYHSLCQQKDRTAKALGITFSHALLFLREFSRACLSNSGGRGKTHQGWLWRCHTLSATTCYDGDSPFSAKNGIEFVSLQLSFCTGSLSMDIRLLRGHHTQCKKHFVLKKKTFLSQQVKHYVTLVWNLGDILGTYYIVKKKTGIGIWTCMCP